MKKFFVAPLLIVSMMASMFSWTPIFAASTDGVYSVDSNEAFTRAVQEIKASDASDATIVLQADVTTNDFSGIDGKDITIKSEDATNFYLDVSDTFKLSGALTLQNVHLGAHTIYANGHKLVLDKGFGGGKDGKTRMMVYGGSDRDLTADTNVIIRDGVYKVVAGGNSAGTLTGDTRIDFGGDAVFPTAADGKQAEDFGGQEKDENWNLYLKAKTEPIWNGPVLAGSKCTLGILPYGIYGGGIGGNTHGSTNVTMNGGKVFQIFGGGAVRTNPNLEKKDLGCVTGDTHVTVNDGEVKSVFGGGYNDLYVFSSADLNETAPAEARLSRAVVNGDTYVEIGGQAKVVATGRDEAHSDSAMNVAIQGGSYHSSVQNTHVTISGKAKVENGGESYGYGGVYGGGENDIVRGTVFVELKDNASIGNAENQADDKYVIVSQGKYSLLTPLGLNREHRYYGGADYNYQAEIRNENKETYAAQAVVSGGKVDVLGVGIKSVLTDQHPQAINGNVLLRQTGGDLYSIEGGCRSDKKIKVKGNVDVVVQGGHVDRYIIGQYFTDADVIEGTKTITIDGCGAADEALVVPTVGATDLVHITDSANVAVIPKYAVGGRTKVPFYNVKDLTVDQGGMLALTQNANISGDLVMNGALHLGYGFLSPASVTLTAEGTATGSGQLRTIKTPQDPSKDYSQPKTPRNGNECVYALTQGSTMALDLTNPEKYLSVGRKTKDAFKDVWYIVAAPQHTVTFDPQGGNWNGVGDNKTVNVYDGDAVAEEAAPTKEGYTFEGWYTDKTGGNKFDFTKPITGNTTLYAHWKPLTYDVTFDPQGGNWDGDTANKVESAEHGKTVVEPTAPTKEGYTFEGWYIDKTGGNKFDFTKPITGNTILYAHWKPLTYDVTFDPQGGNWDGDTANKVESVEHGKTVVEPTAPTKDGYTFKGWYTKADSGNKFDFTKPITANTTVYAYWTKNSGGGGTVTHKVTLHYDSNGGTEYKDEKYSKNTTVTLDKVPTRVGYQFTGWYADETLTEKIDSIKMTTDKTVYAGWRKATVPDMLNGDDHIAYVVGYPDGTVQPQGNITRAEVASIFYRLLEDDIRQANTTDDNHFNDVNEGMWFNTNVSTMEKLNIVAGRTDTEFAPNASITRAEFAAICARFDTGLTEGASNLIDISGHWAEKDIERAVSLGWISGYEDGTFRPNNYITRAEAMSMINRVLCRLPENESDLLEGMKTWIDCQPGAWYYLAVQEATNSHTYEAKGVVHEHWTGLVENPDWLMEAS